MSRSRTAQVAFLVLVFFYIFPLRLANGFDSSFVIAFAAIFCLAANPGLFSDYIEALGRVAWIVGGSLFVMSISTICTIINNTEDFAFPIIFAKLSASIILGVFILTLMRRRDYCFRSLLKIISFAIFILSLTVLAEFFIPEFKNLINSLLVAADNVSYDDETRFRGLAAAGGASLSLALATGGAISVWLLVFEKKYFYFLGAFVNAAACVVVGRTGLLLSLLNFIVLIIFLISHNRRLLIRILILISAIALIFLNINYNNYFTDGQLWLIENWSFEIFSNLLDGHQASTSSTDHLMTMFHFPENILQLIFGAGFYSKPFFGYALTDVGYLKTIYASGLIGFVIVYFGFGYITTSALRSFEIKSDKNLRLIIVWVAFIFWLVEIKEAFIYQNYASRMAILLFFYLIAMSRMSNVQRIRSVLHG